MGRSVARRAPDNGGAAYDHVVINGMAIGLDEILNKRLLDLDEIGTMRDTFRTNSPFPHLAIENLFNPTLLELIHAEFDDVKWGDWRRYDNSNERKLGTLPGTDFGHATQLYFNTIHSALFIEFLERISGIAGLIPDPTLESGGLHEIPSGGRLGAHLDFNYHPITKLDNRLVFITYLNPDWEPSFGGALELWDADGDHCMVEIEPCFGRSVLFQQSSVSMHGHPDPVKAPGGRARRSAAAYFYSNGVFDSRKAPSHSTVYGRAFSDRHREKIANTVKYFMPPFLVDAVRTLRRITA
jgi:2OG-Fe(II) oxygenase superfamily